MDEDADRAQLGRRERAPLAAAGAATAAEASAGELRPGEAELRGLVAVLRQVVARSVLVNAPPDVIARATTMLEQVDRELEPYSNERAFPRYGSGFDRTNANAILPYSPMIGWLNPLAPPILLELHGDRITGRVRFGAAYEGPPSSVHGSIIAAAFDQILAVANIALGHPAMTASLTIQFRRPTPLHTDLQIEAHTDRVEGRKVFTKGVILAGGEVTAEAEGLFVLVDAAKVGKLFPGAGADKAGR